MATVSKFILVPVGLPGMGKTTLSRFLNATSQAPLRVGKKQNQMTLGTMNKMKQMSEGTLMKMDFMKISYDRILTNNQKEYCAKHPEIDMHQAIDIIRDKAD